MWWEGKERRRPKALQLVLSQNGFLAFQGISVIKGQKLAVRIFGGQGKGNNFLLVEESSLVCILCQGYNIGKPGAGREEC